MNPRHSCLRLRIAFGCLVLLVAIIFDLEESTIVAQPLGEIISTTTTTTAISSAAARTTESSQATTGTPATGRASGVQTTGGTNEYTSVGSKQNTILSRIQSLFRILASVINFFGFGKSKILDSSSSSSNNSSSNIHKKDNKMGQAMRLMSYDQAANKLNAISALTLNGQALKWFRLDDGVMGGRSETNQSLDATTGILHFEGLINTNGGGFASIRTPIPEGTLTSQTKAIRIKYRADGKTYKFLLSVGEGAGGPMAKHPSWQADIPTQAFATAASDNAAAADAWDEVIIPFDSLLPNFGGTSRQPEKDKSVFTFDPLEMRQMGLMLSLKLSNGKPNPVETFGEGEFPFSFQIQSIETVEKKPQEQEQS